MGAIGTFDRGPLPHKEQRIAVMVGKQFIGNILAQRIRAILEDPPHLAVQKVAEAGKHIADLRIVRQYPADQFAMLFCKGVDPVKEKIEHLIFRCMMVFRKSYFFREREPAIVQKVIFIIKIIVEGRTGILRLFAQLANGDFFRGAGERCEDRRWCAV